MRTVLFLVAGFLLLGGSLLLGRLFSANYPAATAVATLAYLVLWLLIAGANMWVASPGPDTRSLKSCPSSC